MRSSTVKNTKESKLKFSVSITSGVFTVVDVFVVATLVLDFKSLISGMIISTFVVVVGFTVVD